MEHSINIVCPGGGSPLSLVEEGEFSFISLAGRQLLLSPWKQAAILDSHREADGVNAAAINQTVVPRGDGASDASCRVCVCALSLSHTDIYNTVDLKVKTQMMVMTMNNMFRPLNHRGEIQCMMIIACIF